MKKAHISTFILLGLMVLMYFVYSDKMSVYALGIALFSNEIVISVSDYIEKKKN